MEKRGWKAGLGGGYEREERGLLEDWGLVRGQGSFQGRQEGQHTAAGPARFLAGAL